MLFGAHKMKSVLALAIAALVSLGGMASAEKQTLRIATEGAYPPFNVIDASGKLTGFDVEIAHALCKEMDANCSIVTVPWVEIITRLEQHEYDLVVASMSLTDERAKRMEFSTPYYRSHSAFAGDPQKFHDISPAALKGIKIGAGKDTMQAEYLKKVYPESTIILAADQPSAQKLLTSGSVELMLADSIELLAFLQSPENSRFDYVGDPLTSDLLRSTSHVTASKGNTELIQQVNEALSQIRLNGTYDRINNNYFPFSIY